GVEVVWFDYEMLYDGINKPAIPEKHSMQFHKLNNSLKITSYIFSIEYMLFFNKIILLEDIAKSDHIVENSRFIIANDFGICY
ncbi:hypothetical protein KJQ68_08115, partial [Campylobacter coli]|nr:hypothetical protein [Campylobacter coli]